MCHVAAQKSKTLLRYKGVIVGTTGNSIVWECMSNDLYNEKMGTAIFIMLGPTAMYWNITDYCSKIVGILLITVVILLFVAVLLNSKLNYLEILSELCLLPQSSNITVLAEK